MPSFWAIQLKPRFLKTAAEVEKPPWNHERAATALREWVESQLISWLCFSLLDVFFIIRE
jgi:hypothetical protein